MLYKFFYPTANSKSNLFEDFSATQYCGLIPSRIYNRSLNEISFVHVIVVGKNPLSYP